MGGRIQKRDGDGGVALIEAALAVPFLVLLLLGTIEAGFAWSDANTLARTVQQAARTDARIATGPLADYEALRAINSGLAGLRASSIERVVIYRSNGLGDTPSAECRNVPRPNDLSAVSRPGCNVYSAAQVAAEAPHMFGSCSGGWDSGYCPANRIRGGTDPDRLGVWVKLSFDQVTSALPASMHITRGAVYQLEPCVAGDSSC